MCAFLAGERTAVRDAAANAQPVSRHAARGPGPPHSILRPAAQRVLLRPKPAQFWRHPLLLPEWRPPPEAGQRPTRCLLRGDQVLRAWGNRHQQIQVKTNAHSPLILLFSALRDTLLSALLTVISVYYTLIYTTLWKRWKKVCAMAACDFCVLNLGQFFNRHCYGFQFTLSNFYKNSWVDFQNWLRWTLWHYCKRFHL